MPVLSAGASRIGTTIQQNALKLQSSKVGLCTQRRHASTTRGQPPKAAGRQSFAKQVQRDERGNVIKPQKDKHLGLFRPMSAKELTSPLFQTQGSLNLPTLHPKTMKPEMVGRAVEFPIANNDPIRVYGLPRTTHKEFRLLSKPCSIIRDVTVDATSMLDTAKTKPSSETSRVFTGPAGCGKSFLLLQCTKHCQTEGWVVLYIPRAVNLVNSTTTHIYDLRTRTYLQPAYSYQILQRLLSVNEPLLAKLKTQKKFSLEKRDLDAQTPLVDLINIGIKDKSAAPTVLDAVVTTLSEQTQYPVLLAVDDFQSLFAQTAYRDPHFQRIRPYHLSLPRLILEFASGKRSFARGAFLGSITESDTQYSSSTELKDYLNLYPGQPAGPYAKRSRMLVEYAKGFQAFPVPEKLSVKEAASIFEVWMEDKAVTPSVRDELFLSKYIEASGNAREFVWKGLLSTLEL
ncbi:hypothetical protein BDN72DRAFT_132569 [Pluteus cervinus]|uniref:Uncharacterized protein n=1 Tax=Pluteus cervinus TaxID=181527 RepID=A0ACD3AMD9_9AGAR|nr:hypothetical protein BDN72DRAFT_132569 [Pluteus cervinus]